jgi:GDP-L-fucose synthase
MFAGYAKRMGELQAQAYSIEHGWNAVHIVRPANVYGPYDNFDPQTGMVIPALIARFASDENPVKIWGDGSAVRDFIYSEDVADGMISLVKSNFLEPVNLGSGKGIRISEVVQILSSLFPKKLVVWDAKSPKGDDTRILETIRARNLGIIPKVNLIEGISKVVNLYLNNKSFISTKYNAFNEYK